VNITIVNGLSKLRSNELEDLILGIDYVNRLRSHHAKLWSGKTWIGKQSLGSILIWIWS
jgi:hypothetical protein